MQIEQEVGTKFLNSNLLKYYQNKEYSVEGIPCAFDVFRSPYTTYSIRTDKMIGNLDVSDASLPNSLKKIIEAVNIIVQGLISAKEAEKLEGAETKKRQVEIHWRKYPAVHKDDDIRYCSSKVNFRISVHHKP